MTKQELIAKLLEALANQTLLTDKHHPTKLHLPQKGRRSVISHEVAGDMYAFLTGGIKSIVEYKNAGGSYFVIVPRDLYGFASSGVTTSGRPFAGYDRIVAVCGAKSKWHIFGTDSKLVDADLASGKLKGGVLLTE